ncbi:GntR family transcriptional regulator [Lactovum odontotermitis]
MSEKNMPLYLEIYKNLESNIIAKKYKVGSILPSEAALQKKYNVSKITVRRALQDLERAGYIKIKKGKGSVVLANPQNLALVGLTSFSQEMIKSGKHPSSVILVFEEIAAPTDISEALQLEPGEVIYHLKRLRLKNGRIIGLNDQYISRKYGFKLREEDLNDLTSIYEMYGLQKFKLEKADEIIESVIPDEELMKDMFLKHKIALFKRTRITYDDLNRPLEVSKNYYRADEYRYFITLQINNNDN